jgi:hypothetical protein
MQGIQPAGGFGGPVGAAATSSNHGSVAGLSSPPPPSLDSMPLPPPAPGDNFAPQPPASPTGAPQYGLGNTYR